MVPALAASCGSQFARVGMAAPGRQARAQIVLLSRRASFFRALSISREWCVKSDTLAKLGLQSATLVGSYLK